MPGEGQWTGRCFRRQVFSSLADTPRSNLQSELGYLQLPGVLPMQVSRSIYVLPLVLACTPVLGQSTAEPKAPTPSASALAQEIAAKIKETNDRIAEWQKTCLADWDAQTHMTKAEWAATCRRVSAERGKYLLDEASKGYLPEPIDKAPRKGTRLY